MEDKEIKDQLAAMRAEMDQAKEASREVASTMWMFYSSLCDEGFDSGEAMQLVITWFTIMMTRAGGGTDSE
jgi:cyclopropane fatty-acyl-phospholipid synthase-like methyltransferase